MKRLIIPIIFLFLLPQKQNDAQIKDMDTVISTFEEIKTLLQSDEGKTWGVKLYGPLMFVDPATKYFVANEQNIGNTFTKEGNYFTGRLDEKTMIANTALNIEGKEWTMVMLPLPKDTDVKRELIIHELFHNIQGRLNLKPDAGSNSHLDNKTARIYMRLEWEALLKANIENNKVKRIAHIKNALLFRELRRLEYSDAAVKENCLELQEGLAEYTGVKLGIGKEINRAKYLTDKVKNAAKYYPSFIRSFAYVSGPLYGLLLDRSGKNWRKELKPDSDLGKLLADKFSIKPGSNPKTIFEKNKNEYGFAAIEEFENNREEKNNKLVGLYKDKFVNNPVLILPNKGMQFQFNPNELISLGSTGNVYPHIRVVAAWGELTAEEGAVVAPDWMSVLVSTPFKAEGKMLTGAGWKIELDAKWKVVPKGNSFTLEEAK